MRTRTWSRLVTALAVALGGVAVGAPTSFNPSTPAVDAAADDIVAIVLDGTGNGHGRGLSQWGAYGYAVDHGWDWNQILNHYYGGTEPGSVPAGQRIRVRLSALDGLGTVGLVSYGSPITWNGISRASMYAAESTTAGTFYIFGSADRSCPGGGFSLLGTEVTGVGNPVSFTIATGNTSSITPDQAIGVCAPDGTITHYRGSIDVVDTTSGNRVVNDVFVEDYLRGVLPKEISALWATAGGGAGANAVRAQAVAARSYGLQQARSYLYNDGATRYATTCDTTSCQVYGGAARRSTATASATPVENLLTDAAAVATANVVRRWPVGHPRGGQLVSTEFSASNGPRTAGGEFPAVDDIGDDTTPNPNHRWTRVIDADEIEAQYGLGQLRAADMVDAAASQYQVYDGIWFNDLVLTGVADTERIQAWDFRNTFGLPSPGFTVRVIRENTTGKSVGLIGDSVGESIAGGGVNELNRLIEGTFASATISTAVNRCTARAACAGTSGVEEASALPFGLDLVVVELGYNDTSSTFASDINALMGALTARGARRVAWVNMADIRATAQGSTFGPMNAQLAAAQSNWPTLTVLDWNGASATPEARARWFADGVHLTATGQAEFALWLRAQMLALAPSNYLAPPKMIRIPVVGRAVTTPAGAEVTVPTTATAVAINVTAVVPASPGHITVWPCATPRRETSNLNYSGGDVVANNVIASIDSAGEICLWSFAGTDVIVDVNGWFDGSAAGDALVSVSPERIVDTRLGIGAVQRRVTAAEPLTIDVRALTAKRPDGTTATVPNDVSSVVVNVTAVNATAPGHLTIWPCALGRQETSNLNYRAGRTFANGVVAAVDDTGKLCVHAESPTDVVIDLQGWFGPNNPVFAATDPNRIVDTRIGLGAARQRVSPAAPIRIPVRGISLAANGSTVQVPASATAAVVNVIAVAPIGPGHLTVWSCDGAAPVASNLNYRAGEVIANGVIAPIGSDGSICVSTFAAADIVVDVNGWLADGFVAVTPDRFVDTRIAVGPAPV